MFEPFWLVMLQISSKAMTVGTNLRTLKGHCRKLLLYRRPRALVQTPCVSCVAVVDHHIPIHEMLLGWLQPR